MPLRQGPASSWGLALFMSLLVLLWLLAGTGIAHGQSLSSSEPPNLTDNLGQASQALQTLVGRLTERQQQVKDLQANSLQADSKLIDLAASLATLQADLEAAQASLETSQAALMETSNSLEALSTRYNALETSWANYRSEMKTQTDALMKERNLARGFAWAFAGTTIIGVVVSTILALVMMK